MILNDEQKARMSKFIEFVDIEDICDIMCELPCVMCPLHEKCPMLKEISEHHESLDWLTYKNSCDDVIEQYVTTGEIVDRRNEEDDEKNSG